MQMMHITVNGDVSRIVFTGAKISLELIVNVNKEPEKQVLFLLSQYFLADHQKVLVTPKQLIIALTTAPPHIPALELLDPSFCGLACLIWFSVMYHPGWPFFVINKGIKEKWIKWRQGNATVLRTSSVNRYISDMILELRSGQYCPFIFYRHDDWKDKQMPWVILSAPDRKYALYSEFDISVVTESFDSTCDVF